MNDAYAAATLANAALGVAPAPGEHSETRYRLVGATSQAFAERPIDVMPDPDFLKLKPDPADSCDYIDSVTFVMLKLFPFKCNVCR